MVLQKACDGDMVTEYGGQLEIEDIDELDNLDVESIKEKEHMSHDINESGEVNKEDIIEKKQITTDDKELELSENHPVVETSETGGLVPQSLASLACGLGCLVHGSALVFPAVALPRLQEVTDSQSSHYLGFSLSDTAISWTVATTGLGSLLASVVGPTLGDRLGPRLSCALVVPGLLRSGGPVCTELFNPYQYV